MRPVAIWMGIAVILLFPLFLCSGVITDDEGAVVTADDTNDDDWTSFYDDGEEEEKIDKAYVDPLKIDITVDYPDSYDPSGEPPGIIITTISPFLTNCFFYIQTPDGSTYDIISSAEDQSLRREIMSGERRIYEQSFTVSVPKYYLGKEIRFYIKAMNLVGRESSFGLPASPAVIMLKERGGPLPIGIQILLFLIIIGFCAYMIKKATSKPVKETKKQPARGRRPARRPAVKRDDTYTERDRLL